MYILACGGGLSNPHKPRSGADEKNDGLQCVFRAVLLEQNDILACPQIQFPPSPFSQQQSIMSRPDEEEIVDYDEAAEETTFAPATTEVAKTVGGDKKGSYVGIHSTGFRSVFSSCEFWLALTICRDFLLKPELVRAISDLGFEHPSEG